MQQQIVSVDELVGQTLGSCRVEQLLGRSRLSAVYLGRQSAQDRTVAITLFLIPEEFSASARGRFVARFSMEASALVQLDHPHVLPIYEYGDQFGYPYLVTPYATGGSLANILKQQSSCTPAYTLEILEQVAVGLDYAHSRGVVHGALKPSNILFRNARSVQVAGFGLVRILELRGIVSNYHPQAHFAHMLNIAGTFLGAPEYMAPEFVLGEPLDARSDIYALGIMLFELLSGKLPFTGLDPLEVAMQHVEQPLPSLRALCPDIPADLERVINQALQHDPAHRFQRAGELVTALAQALEDAPQTSARRSITQETEAIQPGIVNTLHEESSPAGKWQLVPPIITGRMPAVSVPISDAMPAVFKTQAIPGATPWQIVPPIVTGHLPAVEPPSTPPVSELVEELSPAIPLQIEPIQKSSSRKRRSARMTRRRVVALLATGGIAAVGAITAGSISLAHLLGNMAHPQPAAGGTSTAPTYANRPPHGTPVHSGPTPTAGKPTPYPTTKPTPHPSHTGNVIGNTNQQVNTSNDFNNTADGKASLLVHLPNNSFVAFEKACTHENVPVYYDTGSHTLVCPAHGSIFDPANGGQVIQGPANRPLPGVTIRVNADGTITTG